MQRYVEYSGTVCTCHQLLTGGGVEAFHVVRVTLQPCRPNVAAQTDTLDFFFFLSFPPNSHHAALAIPCRLRSHSFLFLGCADEQSRFKVGGIMCSARCCPATCTGKRWLFSFLLPFSNHLWPLTATMCFPPTRLLLTGYFCFFGDCPLLTLEMV